MKKDVAIFADTDIVSIVTMHIRLYEDLFVDGPRGGVNFELQKWSINTLA